MHNPEPVKTCSPAFIELAKFMNAFPRTLGLP